MEKKEILEKLEAIGVAIEDSYNTAVDTSENSDSMYYIDSARSLVEELMVSIEGTVGETKHFADGFHSGDWKEDEPTLDEVMNTSPTLARGL